MSKKRSYEDTLWRLIKVLLKYPWAVDAKSTRRRKWMK